MRRRSRRERQRGVALLMVLSTLTVLAVMLSEFQQETSAELGSAMSERDAVQAEYAAKSAVALTRLLIAAEPTIRQGLGPLLMLMRMSEVQFPVWQHADLLLSVFNDAVGAQAFGAMVGGSMDQTKGLGLPGARFELVIVDEDSKLNFNYPARGTVPSRIVVSNQFLALTNSVQYDKLFEGRDEDGNFKDRRSICSALIDWTDPDTEAEPCTPDVATAVQSGAEDSYYDNMKHLPYSRKNAAFDSFEEMHMVRGFDDELWGTFIDPDPDDPTRRVVTVWGSDRVNVNTANGLTIMALVCPFVLEQNPACTDPTTRSKVISIIEMMRGMLPGVPAFRSAKNFIGFLKSNTKQTGDAAGSAGKSDSTSDVGAAGDAMGEAAGSLLGSLGIPPLKLNESALRERLKVKSDVFSVYATGIVKNGKRETRTRVHAVVDFRGAPPPGEARSAADLALVAGGLSGASGTGTSSGSSSAELPPDVDGSLVTPESILSALQASAGGSIIYYRIN